MNVPSSFLIAKTCEFCSADNRLNISSQVLLEHEAVHCSTCGGRLGTVSELKPAAVEERKTLIPAE